MRLGRHNRPLQYQTSTAVQGRLGQESLTWTAVGTVWGEVRAPIGNEVFVANQLATVASDVIETSYEGYLYAPKSRLIDQATGRIFTVILCTDPRGRNRILKTYCVEVVNPPATDASNL